MLIACSAYTLHNSNRVRCVGIHKIIVRIVQVYLLLFELTIRNILRCANKWHLRCNIQRSEPFHCYRIIIICLDDTRQQLVEWIVIAFALRQFLPSTQFQLSTLKLLCVFYLRLQFLQLEIGLPLICNDRFRHMHIDYNDVIL